MSEANEAVQIRYFDPFGENGLTEIPDIEASRRAITENYKSGTVEYNAALDNFVLDVAADYQKARFQNRIGIAQNMWAQLHEMCCKDQEVASRAQGNATFSGLFANEHQGHNHNHEHQLRSVQNTEEIDPKTGKKKRRNLGKFSIFASSSAEKTKSNSKYRLPLAA